MLPYLRLLEKRGSANDARFSPPLDARLPPPVMRKATDEAPSATH